MRLIHVLASLALPSLLLGAPTLKLTGSTTLKGVLEPHIPALEAASGRHLEFVGNGSITGLASLAVGACDVAMLSLPVEDAVNAVNTRTPGRVDARSLWTERLGEVRMVFIVNPRNPVRQLSAVQLGDVLGGRVDNWRDVGGPDAAILVVSLGNSGVALDSLLHGAPMSSSSRVVSNATQIAAIVAQEPYAIGIINSAHPRGLTTVLQTDAVISAPLLLVTKGKPEPEVLKLAESARALLADTSG